jgi:hypothetical protein
MKKSLFALGLWLLFVQTVFAGEDERSIMLRSPDPKFTVTGNAQIDFFGQQVLSSQLQSETNSSLEGHLKSPWLAAGLSVVLPGAGEFYAESYWKAAAFLAIDVTLIALAYSFDKKADRQDAANGRYADEHWSVVRYIEKTFETFPEIDRARYAGILNPNTSLPSWERVDWNLLNQLEREVGSGAGDIRRSYSHTLPRRPEQQYYELIGKYGQYTLGWDDHSGAYNPYESQNTGRFRLYAGERAKAEDWYSTASTFVTVTIINHLLSAADAAWTAATFNKRLHASMRMQRVPALGGFTNVPVARVEYSF